MPRTVAIGIQDFETIIKNGYFYIDKTKFIKEWWGGGDSVTLITRPRRFGKTLNMSMVEQFFSVKYAGRGDLFEKLAIWEDEEYRKLQGTYPVISLSFANVKETDFDMTVYRICNILMKLFEQNAFLLETDVLSETEKSYFRRMSETMDKKDAPLSLYQLSDFLSRYYNKKVIILLDEYDTPMQEAYVDGYWDELVAFTRSLFNATFKTNPFLERAVMTGITRVSRESLFSDLNNLKVVTTTSDEYADAFGFTEQEVFAAIEEQGYHDRDKVKYWYDGFTFGTIKDIYNPWSIINYIDTGKFSTYWANTSSNSLAGKLVREGSKNIKQSFERLIAGEHIQTAVDEQIVYNRLDQDENAIWSLLLAGGYLKVVAIDIPPEMDSAEDGIYEMELTNYEVQKTFRSMIKGWFAAEQSDYGDFIKALLLGDLDAMNEYMNRVTSEIFSYFDTGKRKSNRDEPERFYHGFVLGLLVELESRYVLTSNRESGFGRYDVMLKPKKQEDDAIIMEFKVHNPRKDKSLEDTVAAALAQLRDKQYEAQLVAEGIPQERIRKYGFGFQGKTVLIGE